MPVHTVPSHEGAEKLTHGVRWIEAAGETIVSVLEVRGLFVIVTRPVLEVKVSQRAKPKGVEKRAAS